MCVPAGTPETWQHNWYFSGMEGKAHQADMWESKEQMVLCMENKWQRMFKFMDTTKIKYHLKRKLGKPGLRKHCMLSWRAVYDDQEVVPRESFGVETQNGNRWEYLVTHQLWTKENWVLCICLSFLKKSPLMYENLKSKLECKLYHF